jgi:hypothetical protein
LHEEIRYREGLENLENVRTKLEAEFVDFFVDGLRFVGGKELEGQEPASILC